MPRTASHSGQVQIFGELAAGARSSRSAHSVMSLSQCGHTDIRLQTARTFIKLAGLRSTHRPLPSAVAVQGAEPPPSSASRASGREGRSARLCSLSPCGNLFLPLGPSLDSLPPSHKPRTVGATSKLAPVARGRCPRVLHSGTTTANRFDSRPSVEGRAPEHRELNRRDNPRNGSRKRGSQHPLRPAARPVDRKRKPGRVHVVRKALRAFRE